MLVSLSSPYPPLVIIIIVVGFLLVIILELGRRLLAGPRRQEGKISASVINIRLVYQGALAGPDMAGSWLGRLAR